MSHNIDFTTFESTCLSDSNFDIGISTTSKCAYNAEHTGYYLVVADACYNSIGFTHTSYLAVQKNGSIMARRYTTTQSGCFGALSVSAIIQCNSGDTISVGLSDSYGISASANTNTTISILRVG